MIHNYLMAKEWSAGNFVIPADDGLRFELKQKLETHVHSGKMLNPANASVRSLLLARLAAVEAYDKVAQKMKNAAHRVS